MKHAAMFNGIGGFQLAAEWMGWDNYMSCEIDSFCNKVTKHHFPNCIQHEDIRTTDFTIYRGLIDILTGGFPCQPYSVAGDRKGKEDERHLWPEMRRAVREIQPGWIVGENVFGLINWNGGLVFDEVQADLEAEGYEVWPYVLPACAVDAPHRRDRVWFIAHTRGNGYERRGFKEDRSAQSQVKSERNKRQRIWSNVDGISKSGIITNSGKSGLSTTEQKEFSGQVWINQRRAVEQFHTSQNGYRGCFDNFPTKSPICNGDDGISRELDGITFSKWRKESIKAGGNTIVPQVAFQIFKAIEQYNALAMAEYTGPGPKA